MVKNFDAGVNLLFEYKYDSKNICKRIDDADLVVQGFQVDETFTPLSVKFECSCYEAPNRSVQISMQMQNRNLLELINLLDQIGKHVLGVQPFETLVVKRYYNT